VSRTVVRVVLRVSRVPFTRVVTRRVRAASRDDHVCRATSAHDNKLFSLTNAHVNNVNLSGHIF
jgi:predicted alpha/beta hydrolase family esterase